MRSAILVCALMMTGGCSTMQPPLTQFPVVPSELTEKCIRPQSIGERKGAAEVLTVVTGNYAHHHACADRHEALGEWVREQTKIR